MKIHFLTLMSCLLFVVFTKAVAVNACPPDASRIFYCLTTNKKEVEVCDAGAQISYRFGRIGQVPEMALSIPRAEVTTWQWPGIGRHLSYSVTIPNGTTRYRVFFSVDRLSDDHDIEAGIDVEINGEHVARIPCRVDTLEQRLEGINLRSDDI